MHTEYQIKVDLITTNVLFLIHVLSIILDLSFELKNSLSRSCITARILFSQKRNIQVARINKLVTQMRIDE